MAMAERNLSMLFDFYEITMSNGYFRNGFYKKNVVFDVFYRTVPDGGGGIPQTKMQEVV